MAITQSMCSSFKQQILLGEHDLATDVLKIALYSSAANLSSATTVYSTNGEVVGTGYASGGEVLTGVTVSLSGAVAYVDFNNVVWSPVQITARGALIYNSSKSNKTIAVLDFGADKTSSPAGLFEIQMPANQPSSALIRIA
jgi:hypothetical protein